MQATTRIRRFKLVLTVEVAKTVLVLREVRRNPIQNHSDSVLVKLIDQRHELLRRAIAAGRRKESRNLIAPGAVEWMLHYGKELDVCKAHLLDVRDELACKLTVIQ